MHWLVAMHWLISQSQQQHALGSCYALAN